MNEPADGRREEFDRRLRRGAVLRLTLDQRTLANPLIQSRDKLAIVVSVLLPHEEVRFLLCTSKTAHYDKATHLKPEILRWVPGEYAWCTAPVTVVVCHQIYTMATDDLWKLHLNGCLTFHGDLRPNHLTSINSILRNSRMLSPEEKRWVVA